MNHSYIKKYQKIFIHIDEIINKIKLQLYFHCWKQNFNLVSCLPTFNLIIVKNVEAKDEERLRSIKEIYCELLYRCGIIRFTGFKGDSRSYIRDNSISRINNIIVNRKTSIVRGCKNTIVKRVFFFSSRTDTIVGSLLRYQKDEADPQRDENRFHFQG